MSDILQRIVAVKREEVAAARSRRNLAAVRAAAREQAPPRGFEAALRAAVGLLLPMPRAPAKRLCRMRSKPRLSRNTARTKPARISPSMMMAIRVSRMALTKS